MIAIRVNGENLDLSSDAELDMNFETPFFFEHSGEVIPGSYSFPIDIKPTAKNLRILGYANRLDLAQGLQMIEGVDIFYDGLPLFQGDLHFKLGGNVNIEIFIVIAEFAKIEDADLSSIDFGGIVDMGATVNDALNHAKDTVENPGSYNYIFAPIKNDSFFPIGVGPTHSKSEWQNYWNQSTGEFESTSDNQVAMPFLRLSWILERIIATQGYSLENKFQIYPSLQNLLIYNNYSIYESSSNWSTSFDPANHVPDLEIKEFFKEIIKTWCLSIRYNIFDKTAIIEPCKDLLDKSPSKNWTKYVQREFTFETGRGGFKSFRFELDELDDFNYKGSDQSKDRFEDGHAPDIFEYVEDLVDVSLQIDKKLYYQWQNGRVYKWLDFLSIYDNRQFGIPWWRVDGFEDGEEILIKGQPIDVRQDPDDLVIQVEGTSDVHGFSNPHGHIRWIQYHGIRSYEDGDWPYSSNHPYAASTQIGSFSHVWPGPYGIYELFWRRWNEFLRDTKEVNFVLYLPVNEFLNFDQGEKVRIGSQNYFVKSMKAKFSRGKYIRTEAVMLSTN